MFYKSMRLGKISAQPHTTLSIQFLDKENNDKNNTLPLGKQICFTIGWDYAEILPAIVLEILPQAAGPDGKLNSVRIQAPKNFELVRDPHLCIH